MSEENMSEVISSLVDGEAKLSESDIESIKNNPEVAKKWSNYHLISNIIKETAPTAIPKDFAANVMHAISQEPVVLAPKSKSISKAWFRPAAGFAVAATVAMATIGGLQTAWNPVSGDKTDVLISSVAPNTLNSAENLVVSQNASLSQVNAIPVNSAARAVGLNVSNAYQQSYSDNLRWKRMAPANNADSSEMANKKMAKELNRMLMNHVRSAGTIQGMLPYARIAGYDEN